jgi:small-conductance mechanosensitive channel
MEQALQLFQTLSPLVYAGTLLFVALLLWSSNRRHQRNIAVLDEKYQQETAALKSEIKALLSSAEGMGEKLQQMEHSMQLLARRQDDLTLKEPSQQVYTNAIRMVRHGDDVDTVMERNGLSRGEVELLQLLNGIHKDEGDNQTAA